MKMLTSASSNQYVVAEVARRPTYLGVYCYLNPISLTAEQSKTVLVDRALVRLVRMGVFLKRRDMNEYFEYNKISEGSKIFKLGSNDVL